MKVGIRIEVLLIERIDERGPTLRNVGMAKNFAHHGPVLTFHESVVIGLPGAGFRELDQELVQQRGYPSIDIFRPIIGMEPTDEEGEGGQQ